MKPRFLDATFLQFMGTVGSGIFVLPYVFRQSNLLFATIFLIYLTIVTALLNQFYVDIITHTKGDHQMAGYAFIYLGKPYRFLAAINILLISFGVIVALSLLFARFFTILLPSTPSFLGLTFYLLLLTISFVNRQRLQKKYFLFIPVFMLLIPLILTTISLTSYHFPIFIQTLPNFSFFGATLFALSGFTIIPEVQEIFGTNRPNLHKKLSLAVFGGLLLAVTTYLLFIYSVISISGSNLSPDSITGLSQSLPLLSKFIALFGLIITYRASLNFLVILRELFYRDLKIIRPFADFLPLLFLLATIFLGALSLVSVISITGHVTVFISAFLICLIRLKIKSEFSTKFFAVLIMTSLTLGLLVNFIK